MPSPKVSYSDLEEAFLFASYERQYWLDKKTGEIISFSADVAESLSAGEDLSDYPDWQQREIEDARRVLRAFGEVPENAQDELEAARNEKEDAAEENRYVSIDQVPSNEAFEWMREFADTVTDSRLQWLLYRALDGRHPFRRFKDALLDFPQERERWFACESGRRREYIESWARDEGIEIYFDPRPTHGD